MRSGYLDKHGAWGVYASQRSQGASFYFAASSSQPRVFRLFLQCAERENEDAALALPFLEEESSDDAAAGLASAGSMGDGGLVHPLAWDEAGAEPSDGSEYEGSGSELLLQSGVEAQAVRATPPDVQLAPGCVCGMCWAG